MASKKDIKTRAARTWERARRPNREHVEKLKGRVPFWFIALERCCKQQLLIAASGQTPRLVPEDKARYSREHVGSDYIGWLHFQPIYDDLVATQPDMFT